MSLRFIYGRAGSGKSYYCLQSIKKAIEKEEKERTLILLVPEQFSFQTEKDLISAVGEKGIAKAEVLSFKRMAHKVFNEVGGITRQYMNASGRSMLIYSIMRRNRENFKMFSKAAKKQGFVGIISDMITEFKRYNITPEILIETCNKTDNITLNQKLHDISLIFSEFEEQLHKKYIDSEDDLTILYDKLEKSNMFEDAEVWIDEFSSFTPQQYKVIERILKKAKRVNITLCTDGLSNGESIDNTDMFLLTKATEEKLLKIIQENGIAYEKPIALKCEPCYRFKDSEELSHMERYLFSFPYKMYNKETKDISIFKAINKYSEIEEIARDIITLTRDKNMRFNDIAVISGDLNGYEKLVKSIFSEYEIPYFIDKKRKVKNNPLVVFIVSAVEIIAKGWNYESIFKYLKTGLTEIKKEDIDLIENYVLANGIKGKKKWVDTEKWEYRFTYGASEGEKTEYEINKIDKINETKSRIVLGLNNLYNSLRKKDKAEHMCKALYEFLCETKIPDRIMHLIDNFKEQNLLDMANEYSQVWEIVVDILDQIVEVMGEDEITSEEFSKILSSGFEEYEIGVIPPSLDQILVSSVERIRSHFIKVVYIIGVNDGVFPTSFAEEGILSDSDRILLNERGIELAKDTKSKAFEEQFLTYITMTTTSKYLKLSYPLADSEGKALRPSIIISRLKKIFPNICEESNVVLKSSAQEDLKRIVGAKPSFNELVAELRQEEEEFNIKPIWLLVYKWYIQNQEWKEKLQRVLSGFSYSNQEEILDTKKIRELYGKPMTISVSRLEKYVECPFAYFTKYGLNAKDRKIFALSSPDIGTFMHSVIDNFSRRLLKEKKNWRDIDKEWCSNIVSQIVDDDIKEKAESVFNSSERYKYLTESFKKVLTRAVVLISEHMKRGGFNPEGYEMSFGKGGDYPPIVVELHSGEGVNLIGRVDRIDALEDENETFLRIIDYKSGAKEFRLSDVYYGLQMQLLIYLDAILTQIGNDTNFEAKPAGILYFRIDDPMIKAKKDMSDEEIEIAIMKSLKMNGLLLDDVNIIKEMDRDVIGNSVIIPVRVNKDGNLGKSSVASEEQFHVLRKYVRSTIVNICENMLEGDIKIRPYKKKNYISCKFCDFSAVCGFDISLKDNKYRIINNKSDEEVWELMDSEVNKNE